jgi:hypothetical protein
MSAFAGEAPVHGLWVWKGATVIQSPADGVKLREFCRAAGINEVYFSVSDHGVMSGLDRAPALIDELHRSNIRVEALLSSVDADQPGKHRDQFMDRVRSVLQYDRQHAGAGFDGVHLDIEPQQRPENKGAGNLRFLPDLLDAYRAVRMLAEPAGLTVNADIQRKLLEAGPEQRRLLLTSLPRLTLMLYEVSDPVETGSKYLRMAFDGLDLARSAGIALALRTPDFGSRLPAMLAALDQANASDPHYLGWARHSYNDLVP